ncbi:MAG: inositol monophosphatase [Spirochaetaceae bacterium]|nr:inositol monophosphatase [Spirochaetaceae bacterium]
MDTAEIKKVMIDAARKAGEVIREDYISLKQVHAKGLHDVVTDTDYHSEQIILSAIQSHFPNHRIIAEESGTSGNDKEYTWFVDPLDGTSNFVTGIPYFSVSIAVAHKGSIILGVVYNPIVEEFYFAEKGGGAFLNNEPIRVSGRSKLSAAYAATAFSEQKANVSSGLKTADILIRSCRRVVINFAPALDLCNIARGRLDLLIDNGSVPVDHAAGSIILAEAGGYLQNLGKTTWDINVTGITASNGKLKLPLELLTQTDYLLPQEADSRAD